MQIKKCPTCGARHAGKPRCHRCGTNLEKLSVVLNRAMVHGNEALRAHDKKDYPRMLSHARRAVSLKRTPWSLRLLARSLILNSRFQDALAAWREVSYSKDGGA